MATKWNNLYVNNLQYDTITPALLGDIHVITSDITYTDIAGGSITIFTPTGSDAYVVLGMNTIASASTNFDAGGDKRINYYYPVAQDGGPFYLSLDATRLKVISSGDMAVPTIPASFGPRVTSTTPITFVSVGTTDYVAGTVRIQTALAKVA